MAKKTLTLSEKAYRALDQLKSKDERVAKPIPRRVQGSTKGNLLDYVRSFAPDNELADRIEAVLKKRDSIRLRASER
ncbi:MAG: hypothetical protein AUF79_18050 [Crenarchaeota archaeon 13_1_20CM_2_51_8]|nr:MAG: hypothetical protein AUF79_18050 [Crenarchaeota archaeon 13_1_20CM_2_51_8]